MSMLDSPKSVRFDETEQVEMLYDNYALKLSWEREHHRAAVPVSRLGWIQKWQHRQYMKHQQRKNTWIQRHGDVPRKHAHVRIRARNVSE